MRYIDFDNVIMDTLPELFKDLTPEEITSRTKEARDKRCYASKNNNWKNVLENSKEINNSLEIIKSLDNIAILTKVNSLENEATEKINFLRKNGITCNIIIVPINKEKSSVVEAKGNILVDDDIHNLEDWEKNGGTPIFFEKNNNDFDHHQRKNTKYLKTDNLNILKKENL